MTTGVLDEADYCCVMMTRQMTQRCEQHPSPWDCPDRVVIVLPDGTYGLPVRTGENVAASSALPVWHCPWCAEALPGHQAHVPGLVPAPELAKARTPDEIDRRIEDWHNGDGGVSDLHDYLGWTRSEYERWVKESELPEP